MRFNNNQSALLLIEFQNEWLDPNGKLYDLMENKNTFECSQQQAGVCQQSCRQKN